MTAPKHKQNESTPQPPESDAAAEAAPLPVSPEEPEALKTKAAQADENWDKFLRTAAEFDNYRKRVLREKDELARYTTEKVIGAMLPALDNLERALEHSEEGTPLHDGLLQMHKQFQRSLADFGLVEIVAQPGDHFDPAVHEAVSHVESPDHADGIVTEQLQSGYKLGDRLLRPARVVVSKGSSAAADSPAPPQS